jgi:chemotaxis signal transduction protein
MSTHRSSAELLREAFDRSFAEPPSAPRDAWEDLLAIRCGGQPHAVRVRDIAGIAAGRTIVPAPSPLPELIGLAGFRGRVASVYDLGSLLGLGASGALHWFVLVTEPRLVALAFELLEAHVRVPRASLADSAAHSQPLSRQAVHVAAALRPVVDIAGLIATIEQRGAALRSPREP